MEVIPSVDILDGKVVRLVQGRESKALIYQKRNDPFEVVKLWIDEGTETIHLIDLNAAIGRGNNRRIILRLLERYDINFQVGGGIRSRDLAASLLSNGAYRIILGTLAFENPLIVRDLTEEFGKRIAVAVDHRNGKVVIRGWRSETRVRVEEAIRKYEKLGCKLFLLTSVTRDGTMLGPNVEILRKIDNADEMIVAGGIRNLEDLLLLKETGVYGAVVGRALYEGEILLRDAIKLLR